MYEAKFFDYLQSNNLKFSNGQEWVKRLEIYVNNMENIREHNSNPKSTYAMAENQFTHMTPEEFKSLQTRSITHSFPSICW